MVGVTAFVMYLSGDWSKYVSKSSYRKPSPT